MVKCQVFIGGMPGKSDFAAGGGKDLYDHKI